MAVAVRISGSDAVAQQLAIDQIKHDQVKPESGT